MKKNEKVLKILKPLRHCNHKKMKNIIEALIDYYSGVPRVTIAENHSLSKRTYDRILSIFKNQNGKIYYHLLDLWHCLKHCPLEFEMPFSIWTPELLKLYTMSAYKIHVTYEFCKYLIRLFYDSYYDKSEFIFEKTFYLNSPMVKFIREHEEDEFCICIALFGFLDYYEKKPDKRKDRPHYKEIVIPESKPKNPISLGVLFYTNHNVYGDARYSTSLKGYTAIKETLKEYICKIYLKETAVNSKALFILLEKNLENVRAADLLLREVDHVTYNYFIYFVPKDFDYICLNSFGKIVFPNINTTFKRQFEDICKNVASEPKPPQNTRRTKPKPRTYIAARFVNQIKKQFFETA